MIRKLEAIELTHGDDSALAGFLLLMATDVPTLKRFGTRIKEEAAKGKISEQGAVVLRALYSVRLQLMQEAERAKKKQH